MKNILNPILFVLIIFSGCKPSPQKAEDYYLKIEKQLYYVIEKETVLINYINIERDKIDSIEKSTKKIKNRLNTLDSINNKIESAYNDLKIQIDNSIIEVEKNESFNNNSKLLDAAKNVLMAYKEVVDNEYVSIIKISGIPLSLYTEEDDSKFLELNETVDNKLQKKIEEYIYTAKAFSQEYKFIIPSDSAAVNLN